MLEENDFWRAFFTPVRRLSDMSEVDRMQVLAATEAYFLDLASPMEVHGVCTRIFFCYINGYMASLSLKKYFWIKRTTQKKEIIESYHVNL